MESVNERPVVVVVIGFHPLATASALPRLPSQPALLPAAEAMAFGSQSSTNGSPHSTLATLTVGVVAGVALSWCWHRVSEQVAAALNAPLAVLRRWRQPWRKRSTASHPFAMEEHLSLVAKAKRPAMLRGLIPLSKIEGMAVMSGGTPHPSLFPVKSYTLELVDGERITIDDPTLVGKAQQYMHDVTPGVGTVGYIPLLEWIRTHVAEQHAPPYEGWDVCVCTGNADGFQRAWDTLLDPGDTLLVDELDFSFSTSQLCAWVGAKQLHLEALPLGGGEGEYALALRTRLESWASTHPGLRFPKMLFTIPAFQNPTCRSRSPSEMQAVYRVCSDFDLILVEDDPYRFLKFGEPLDADADVPGYTGAQGGGLPPSFLSLDTDGRVVRCDTFSKWMGPGLRCGWVTAPRAVIAKLAQGTGPSLGVASSVQVMLVAMLERWGTRGLDRHVLIAR